MPAGRRYQDREKRTLTAAQAAIHDAAAPTPRARPQRRGLRCQRKAVSGGVRRRRAASGGRARAPGRGRAEPLAAGRGGRRGGGGPGAGRRAAARGRRVELVLRLRRWAGRRRGGPEGNAAAQGRASPRRGAPHAPRPPATAENERLWPPRAAGE